MSLYNESFHCFRPCKNVFTLSDWSYLYGSEHLSFDVYIFQTISCQDCKFKEQDCLHFKWILYVSNTTMY